MARHHHGTSPSRTALHAYRSLDGTLSAIERLVALVVWLSGHLGVGINAAEP